MRTKVQRMAAFCGIDDAIVLADVANRRRNRFAATPGNTPPAEFVRTKQQDNNVDQRYANGQKRCNVCEIFVDWDGFYCPCCRMLLRSRPRSVKGKIYVRIRA